MSWVKRGTNMVGGEVEDGYGYSVSLSSDGTVMAAGAIDTSDGKGYVRVYKWNGSIWEQRGSDIYGEAASDESGYSVSLSSDGSIVAIGAPSNDGNDNIQGGHVRVYYWNGTSWVQRGEDINAEAAINNLGNSVSLSSDGTILAIGAPMNTGTGLFSGHVRVYYWNATSWVQRGSDIDGESGNDFSGHSVSLSSDGSIIAINAINNSGNNNEYPGIGHVRVYYWNGTSWIQRGSDIDGEAAGDNSGVSVSLSSDGLIVAIGAYNNTGVNGAYSGHVRIYNWNGTSWVQRGSDIDGETIYSQSGYSVSLSSDGSIIAIGEITPGENSPGQVKVYNWQPSSNVPCIVEGQRILTQRGYVKIETLESTDYIITSDNRQVAANVYKFTVDNTTEKTAPITIKAHAFAHNSPPNDIRLSPLHAIQRSKGVWDIPIKAMKRYENVVQDAPGSQVTYYHIETPNFFKDNLVVEGATVESFAGQIAKKHNLKPTDIYKWSSTLQGYTRSNPCITKSK